MCFPRPAIEEAEGVMEENQNRPMVPSPNNGTASFDPSAGGMVGGLFV